MPISDEVFAEQTREDRLQFQFLVDGGMSESKALRKIFPNDSNRSRKLKVWKDRGLFPVPRSECITGDTHSAHRSTTSYEPVSPPIVATDQEVPESELPTTGNAECPPDTPPVNTALEADSSETTTVDDTPDTEHATSGGRLLGLPVTTGLGSTAPPVIEKTETDLLALIDERVDTRLRSLVSTVEASEQRKNLGGRGHQGKTHTKINISIPEELNEALESIVSESGGSKSAHIAAAIRLYLEIRNR